MTFKTKVFITAAVLIGWILALLFVVELDTGSGVVQLIGLGLSVALILGIWFWPGIEQPKNPPD